jgi:transcriptional regulator with XRE-family HTH domain
MIVRSAADSRAGAPPSPLIQREAALLGREARDARRRLHLDQKDVAFAANVSPRTVFAIEKGKPTVRLDMLMRVLAAVGLRLTVEDRDRAWRPGATDTR